MIDNVNNEKWKAIPICHAYEVSNYGRVRNADGLILAPRKTKTGYQRIHFTIDGKRKDMYIHRLVAEAFCERTDGCDIVNHKDFNPANNHADNLEWTTQRGNVIYSMNVGRVGRFPNAKMIIGEKAGVRYLFRSSREAAQAIGCDHKTILRGCKTGRRTKHGYLWEKVS